LSAGLPEWGYDDDQMSVEGRDSLISTPVHSSTRRILLDEEDDSATPNSSRSRSKRPKRESSLSRSAAQQRLILRTKMEQTPDGGSPAPGGHYPTFAQFVPESGTPSQNAPARRPRPLTQHQLAVEHNRRQRIAYLLAQRKAEIHRIKRIDREGETGIIRYRRLLSNLPDNYDTEDDEHAWGKGGLIPNPEDHEDYGEAASYYLSVIRKAVRRLDRWDLDDSNGPKRDRKKEREEREKVHQENLAAMNMLQLPGRSRTTAGSRNRARNDRNARRKAAGADAGAGAGVVTKRSGGASSSRSKAAKRSARSGTSAGASKSNILPSSPSHANHDGDDETLDDIDKELLGEATENEGDEDQSHIADVSAIPGSDLPEENGYEDSFVGEGGEDEADGLSSDNDLDGDDDELDDDDDNSSGLDDVQAEADSSSEVMNGDHGAEVDVEGDVDHEAEEDEVMDDVED
jgi:Ino eighty subunit 1